MKTAAAFVAIACLVLAHAQGHPRTILKRCSCHGSVVNAVPRHWINKIEVYPASATCPNVEIIVTLKNGTRQKCLNPDSDFTQNYIRRAIKKRNAE